MMWDAQKGYIWERKYAEKRKRKCIQEKFARKPRKSLAPDRKVYESFALHSVHAVNRYIHYVYTCVYSEMKTRRLRRSITSIGRRKHHGGNLPLHTSVCKRKDVTNMCVCVCVQTHI